MIDEITKGGEKDLKFALGSLEGIGRANAHYQRSFETAFATYYSKQVVKEL